jgi:hypothetical protein
MRNGQAHDSNRAGVHSRAALLCFALLCFALLCFEMKIITAIGGL